MKILVEVCDVCKDIHMNLETLNKCPYCKKSNCSNCGECDHVCSCGSKKRANARYCLNCQKHPGDQRIYRFTESWNSIKASQYAKAALRSKIDEMTPQARKLWQERWIEKWNAKQDKRMRAFAGL